MPKIGITTPRMHSLRANGVVCAGSCIDTHKGEWRLHAFKGGFCLILLGLLCIKQEKSILKVNILLIQRKILDEMT